MLRDVGNKVWLFKAKRMEKRGLALGEIEIESSTSL